MTYNSDIIEGKWKQVKGRVQQQWGKLTSDDLSKIKGTHKELVGLIQEKYGYERAQAEKEVSDFVKRNHFDS